MENLNSLPETSQQNGKAVLTTKKTSPKDYT